SPVEPLPPGPLAPSAWGRRRADQKKIDPGGGRPSGRARRDTRRAPPCPRRRRGFSPRAGGGLRWAMAEARPTTLAADWAAATEQQVLDAALGIAPAEGWTARMAALAGQACGLSAGETELLLPQGPADLAALLSHRHDAAAMAALAGIDP